jgi:hypothetical protein
MCFIVLYFSAFYHFMTKYFVGLKEIKLNHEDFNVLLDLL